MNVNVILIVAASLAIAGQAAAIVLRQFSLLFDGLCLFFISIFGLMTWSSSGFLSPRLGWLVYVLVCLSWITTLHCVLPMAKSQPNARPFTLGSPARSFVHFCVAAISAILITATIVYPGLNFAPREPVLRILNGDGSDTIDRFQIDNNQRRVICTDPVLLSEFQARCKQGVRKHPDDFGLFYRVTFSCTHDEVQIMSTGWAEHSVVLYAEGDDGQAPTVVSLLSPISEKMKAMVTFLLSRDVDVLGQVMHIEPEQIWFQKDDKLRAKLNRHK